MSKNLTESSLDRKNILNNNFAVQEVYEHVGFYGIKFDDRYRFTKQQVAHYYEVDICTLDRLLENHKEEFEQSGYELYNGPTLRRFKDQVFDFVKVAKESGGCSRHECLEHPPDGRGLQTTFERRRSVTETHSNP